MMFDSVFGSGANPEQNAEWIIIIDDVLVPMNSKIPIGKAGKSSVRFLMN